MARYPQPPGQKGSLRWIQEYVNDSPEILDRAIAEASGGKIRTPIQWRSPRRDDEYAEYRDQAFVDVLDIGLPVRPLVDFWPRGGPQWDALGVSASGQPILVEAKANIPEVSSPASGAKGESRDRIVAALAETAGFLGVDSTYDWTGTFYQYTNRLAHLYLLAEVNRLDAWLVFVYFVGDASVSGPETEEEWRAALQVLHEALGLPMSHRMGARVVDVFVDVRAGAKPG